MASRSKYFEGQTRGLRKVYVGPSRARECRRVVTVSRCCEVAVSVLLLMLFVKLFDVDEAVEFVDAAAATSPPLLLLLLTLLTLLSLSLSFSFSLSPHPY
eukprot:gnl/Chilomastix_caulleri/1177.p1 GENE.gnl/Chilomastix_caulleri/1177~~gnl/Chilomastix_caulleri/1177.p1  ORF type:complete len:100 (-),score=25.57 gnl/Chilomastix_caulleri/1177:72-371(-)